MAVNRTAEREAEQLATRGNPVGWDVGKSKIVEQAKSPGILGTLGKVWGVVTLVAFVAMPIGGVARFAAGKMGVGATKVAFSKVTQVTELVTKVTAKEAAGHVGTIFGEKSAIAKGAHTFSDTVSRQAQKIASKSSWAKNAVENIKGNQLTGTLFTAVNIGQTAKGMWDAKYDKARTLQQMQFDLTGEKISKSEALHSKKLDPFLMKLRDGSKNWKSRTATLMDAASIAGNLHLLTAKDSAEGTAKSALSKMTGGLINKTTMTSALITFIPGKAADGLRESDPANMALKAYQQAYLSFAQSGQIDIGLREAVIGGIHPNASSKLVHEVAQKAMEQNFSPAEMLRMLKETNFMDPEKSHTARLSAARAAQPSRAATVGA